MMELNIQALAARNAQPGRVDGWTHKPHTLLHERDAQFLARDEDVLVRLAAGGAGDVFDAGTAGAEDVVNEGELCLCISVV